MNKTNISSYLNKSKERITKNHTQKQVQEVKPMRYMIKLSLFLKVQLTIFLFMGNHLD